MDDVVLSVVKNRFWKDLDVYALSLCQSGYQGRKVMFVEDVPADAQENLKVLGFEVLQFKTPPRHEHLHFQSYRYLVAKDFLTENRFLLRKVLWTDVSDLLFQSDPMEHVETNEIVAAKEGRKMNAGGGQGWNEIWVRHFLPRSEADKLMEEEVLCSGSIAGCSGWMTALFQSISSWCGSFGGLRGIDQGIFNYVVRCAEFKDYLRVPEMREGFVSTCGMFMSEYNNHEWTVEPPYLDRDEGLVRVSEGGKPFAIAHCYDRTGGYLNPIGDFRGIVERRYRK
jgi:hypothetical protein